MEVLVEAMVAGAEGLATDEALAEAGVEVGDEAMGEALVEAGVEVGDEEASEEGDWTKKTSSATSVEFTCNKSNQFTHK